MNNTYGDDETSFYEEYEVYEGEFSSCYAHKNPLKTLKNLSVEQKIFLQVMFPERNLYNVHEYIKYIIRNISDFKILPYLYEKVGLYALIHFNEEFSQEEYYIIITKLLPILEHNAFFCYNKYVHELVITNKLNENNFKSLRKFIHDTKLILTNNSVYTFLQKVDFSEINSSLYNTMFINTTVHYSHASFNIDNYKTISKLATIIPQEDFDELFNILLYRVQSSSQLKDVFICMNDLYKYILLSSNVYESLWNTFEFIEGNTSNNNKDKNLYKELLSLSEEIFPKEYKDKIDAKLLMFDLKDE